MKEGGFNSNCCQYPWAVFARFLEIPSNFIRSLSFCFLRACATSVVLDGLQMGLVHASLDDDLGVRSRVFAGDRIIMIPPFLEDSLDIVKRIERGSFMEVAEGRSLCHAVEEEEKIGCPPATFPQK